MRWIIFALLLFGLVLSGCQTDNICNPGEEQIVSCVSLNTTQNENSDVSIMDTITTTSMESTTTMKVTETTTTVPTTETLPASTSTTLTSTTLGAEASEDVSYVKNYKEGDLISFKNIKVIDPDNDKITLTFSEPLNSEGEWQTKKGDAGTYVVSITASDGKAETVQKIKLVIEKSNSAPVINVPDKLTFKEGEVAKIPATVTDDDNDKTTLKVTGWMTALEKKLGYDDAGTHDVVLIASDGKEDVTKKVTIVVENVNRPPVMEDFAPVEIAEGELLKVVPKVSDPDGDELSFSFEKPLDENGEWQTKVGDAGSYIFTVAASDGKDTVSKKIQVEVTVLNHAPVIEIDTVMNFKEGEKITLNPKVTDEDNDQLSITYSGWMNTNEHEIGYDEQGTHKVIVTASDGKTETKKEITINVEDVNRPPVFTI